MLIHFEMAVNLFTVVKCILSYHKNPASVIDIIIIKVKLFFQKLLNIL